MISTGRTPPCSLHNGPQVGIIYIATLDYHLCSLSILSVLLSHTITIRRFTPFKIVSMYLILPVFPEVFTISSGATKVRLSPFGTRDLICFAQIDCNPLIISDAVTYRKHCFFFRALPPSMRICASAAVLASDFSRFSH